MRLLIPPEAIIGWHGTNFLAMPTRKRKAQQQDGATKPNTNKRTYHATRPSTSTERSRRARGQPVGQARKLGRKPNSGKAMTVAERVRKSRRGMKMMA